MNKANPKAPNLSRVQLLRKVVLLFVMLGGIAFVSVAASRWESGSEMHELIEWLGICLIVICISGRIWSALYIGGRKTKELVDIGPYSVSRNPLYMFSFIGAAGAGAQLGCFSLGIIVALIAWAVFSLVVMKEEQALRAKFGAPYEKYMQRVPRFFPKFSLWRDVPYVEVNTKMVRRTAIDAFVFVLSMPLAEGIEQLQNDGVLPILFRLP